MGASKVQDIVVGALDFTGSPISHVYAKVTGRYAVYRNTERVMIHFCDEDDEGVNQRAALSVLAAVRGRIAGMTVTLQKNPRAYCQSKAEEYDRRVADALVIGLQGDPPQALAELNAIRDDLVEDRASDIRTFHLLAALVAVALFLMASRLLSSQSFDNAFGPFADFADKYWQAAAIGSLGALFSIALQLRAREVPIDIQPWDNRMDAVLRVFVGSASAVLLVALVLGNYVGLSIGTQSLGAPQGLVVVAFVAGFGERLVADFLKGITIGQRSSAARTPASPAPAAGKVANEKDIAQTSAAIAVTTTRRSEPLSDLPDPDDDEQDDGCLENVEIEADDLTADVELPEATGGVAERSPV